MMEYKSNRPASEPAAKKVPHNCYIADAAVGQEAAVEQGRQRNSKTLVFFQKVATIHDIGRTAALSHGQFFCP